MDLIQNHAEAVTYRINQTSPHQFVQPEVDYISTFDTRSDGIKNHWITATVVFQQSIDATYKPDLHNLVWTIFEELESCIAQKFVREHQLNGTPKEMFYPDKFKVLYAHLIPNANATYIPPWMRVSLSFNDTLEQADNSHLISIAESLQDGIVKRIQETFKILSRHNDVTDIPDSSKEGEIFCLDRFMTLIRYSYDDLRAED
ncbi:hypothetical protein F5Y15DRAFT_420564 [Xylariaceae sp. FL0016]|nr:hypothetical protein F5Y15DRAFT_420564 [Xylariaceae sp. FL0016]